MQTIHCTKNHVFFFQTSWKDGHSKIIAPEYDLPCIIGKDDVFFPENMILFFRQKMKDDLCRKKYMEIWYFLQMFRKDGIFKKIVLEYDLSCLTWKDSIFFPENMILFLWTKNERWSFSRNTWKYDIFCIYA